MCGIVGFVAARGSEPLPSHGLDDAIAALHHRGPDEHGAFRAEGVALGNTRLSIIDLPGGSQPMTNEDGTVVVVYNGEIWNHASVRLELERLGHRFRTRSDTEVLAHGYEEWGRDLPTHLDGMFAFAVWDTRREQLFLARDRLGKKPLYVLETARGLAFGSDARSLFLITGLEPALDTAHVAEYLFRRYVVSPHTLFAGVERLPAAHRATYDRTQSMIDRYWQLDVPQTAEPFDPAALREALGRAVERRLMSDVPIGVLLSGGVDSSGILALAHRAGASQLATFTIGFDDPVFDERPLARVAAARFATEHHEVVVGGGNFIDALPRLTWFRDEPIAEASEIPLLLLSEFAGQHVKVALTGDGGDEVFGGYPKYRVDAFLRAGGRGAALALRGALHVASLRRTHRQLDRAATSAAIRNNLERWSGWFRSFEPDVLANLLAPELRRSAAPERLSAPLARVLEPYSDLDEGRQMLLADLLTYLPDNMLLRSDKVLMAASLEGRTPLLDLDVITHASRSSAGDRASLRGSKKTIRKALATLVPDEVLRAPKRGFPVPIETFLVDETRTAMVDVLVSERTLERGLFEPDMLRSLLVDDDRRIGPRELFVLASLELWLRANVDVVTMTPPALGDLIEPSARVAAA